MQPEQTITPGSPTPAPVPEVSQPISVVPAPLTAEEQVATVTAAPSTPVQAGAAPMSTETVAAPATAGQKLQDLRDSKLVAVFLEYSFRVGLGLVFIINSFSALYQPDAFRKLIEGNFISHALGHTQLMLYIIAVNDAILGLLIILGFKKRYVYAWMGIWLFIVTFMKFTSLL